jgi:hypothetical protein
MGWKNSFSPSILFLYAKNIGDGIRVMSCGTSSTKGI